MVEWLVLSQEEALLSEPTVVSELESSSELKKFQLLEKHVFIVVDKHLMTTISQSFYDLWIFFTLCLYKKSLGENIKT